MPEQALSILYTSAILKQLHNVHLLIRYLNKFDIPVAEFLNHEMEQWGRCNNDIRNIREKLYVAVNTPY